jgi:16S rRNA C1402 N4-methylase RsmH
VFILYPVSNPTDKINLHKTYAYRIFGGINISVEQERHESVTFLQLSYDKEFYQNRFTVLAYQSDFNKLYTEIKKLSRVICMSYGCQYTYVKLNLYRVPHKSVTSLSKYCLSPKTEVSDNFNNVAITNVHT